MVQENGDRTAFGSVTLHWYTVIFSRALDAGVTNDVLGVDDRQKTVLQAVIDSSAYNHGHPRHANALRNCLFVSISRSEDRSNRVRKVVKTARA